MEEDFDKETKRLALRLAAVLQKRTSRGSFAAANAAMAVGMRAELETIRGTIRQLGLLAAIPYLAKRKRRRMQETASDTLAREKGAHAQELAVIVNAWEEALAEVHETKKNATEVPEQDVMVLNVAEDRGMLTAYLQIVESDVIQDKHYLGYGLDELLLEVADLAERGGCERVLVVDQGGGPALVQRAHETCPHLFRLVHKLPTLSSGNAAAAS
jgi:hypothetical protein